MHLAVVPLAAGFLLLALAPASAAAQAAESAPQQIVVTGSVAGRDAADAPYAIGVIDAGTLRSAGPMINLSEALARVPGLVVNNRNNYAQDLQISSRGFGARAGFGVRGLRLYSDGIPATMPDGQGQVSHFDLAGAERVEVLRGPFSVLYGNSSGGVVALFGAPVRRAEAEAGLDVGEFGLRQLRASIAAPLGSGFDLRVGASAMEIDGFRPHSEARRGLFNLRGGWQGEHDRVVVLLNSIDQPAQDPLGLTRELFDADPYQTAPQATDFDTRKTARQTQLGASWRHRFAGGGLRESQLAVYGGKRSVVQYLAIPPATQGSPRHGGGVVDFSRDYGGAEARLTWRWSKLNVVTGLAVEAQRDDRQGFENFTGAEEAPVLGVRGRLRRDEANRATSTDGFVQAEFDFSEALTASAGVRSGRVKLRADDKYLDNGDDSGSLAYRYTNPVIGLRWRLSPGLQLHASAARGFESPTLGELAYRPDGAGGFNEGLKPQESKQLEVGLKWRAGALELDAALFRADTDDEIGVLSNAGGRSSFQNVGATRREGAEVAAGWRITPRWRAALAATWLDATYRDAFFTCGPPPCAAADVPVPAGNRIAGTQRSSGFAELAWKPFDGTEVALEWRAAAKTAVNDLNADFAPGWSSTSLRWLQQWALGAEGTKLELLARLENLANKRYAGSVIVNDGNGRFFEPAPPRNALLSLRVIKPL